MKNSYKPKKVLLVEFLIVDRFHCAIIFPYFQGWLQEHGIEVSSVSIGIEAQSAFASADDDNVVISQEDAEALNARIQEFGPSHVLFSTPPASSVFSSCNGLKTCSTGNLAEQDCIVSHSNKAFVSLETWLEISEECAEKFSPTFGSNSNFSWLPINPLAKKHRLLPHILCGPECTYQRSLNRNPEYDNVNLTNCHRTSGCSFCFSPEIEDDAKRREDFLTLLRRHLGNAVKTIQWHGHRPRYRIISHSLTRKLDEFAKCVNSMDLPASDFLFNCRVDDISDHRDQIEKAIQLFVNTGHKICFSLVGVENFSTQELRRFNKGFETVDILKMLTTFFDLRKKYDDVFNFHSYGGFSTILYTPWSTLEDIEFNLRLVSLFGIENLFGKLLSSRLRLYKKLPIFLLAQQDGFIVERYEDSIFDTANRNFYPKEIPWKFKDKRVEIFNRLASRISKNSYLVGEPLYEKVQQSYRNQPDTNNSPVDFALTILRHVKSVKEFTENIEDFLVAGNSNKAVAPATTEEISEHTMAFSIKKFLFEHNADCVGKLEYVESDSIDASVERLKDIFGQHLKVTYNDTIDRPNQSHLFYGYNLSNVENAASLSSRIVEHSQAKDPIARVGTLLGYPQCCSRSFSDTKKYGIEFDEWLHLRNRSAAEDELVDPLMNPFHGPATYVPCSLECESTLKMANGFHRYISEDNQPYSRETMSQTLDSPYIYMLEDPGAFCVLNGATLKRELEKATIYFESVSINGSSEELEYLNHSNSIVIEPGILHAMKGDIPIYSFVLSAAVWWNKHAFHNEFWQHCYQLVKNSYEANRREKQSNWDQSDYERLTISSHNSKQHEKIKELITHFSKIIKKETDYALDKIHFSGKNTECLFLDDHNKAHLEISAIESNTRQFVSGKYFNINYIRNTKPTDRVERLASILLRILERFQEKKASESKSRI